MAKFKDFKGGTPQWANLMEIQDTQNARPT